MDYWFTSDTHFGSKKCAEYRHFDSSDEMDSFIIRRWNECVGCDDIVYHLGDFSNKKSPKFFLDQLNGHVILICGNHDTHPHRSCKKKDGFKDIVDNIKIDVLGTKFFCSHYPMRMWPGQKGDRIMLHGHSHGTLPYMRNSVDVGVDCNQFAPFNYDDVLDMVCLRFTESIV